jgi:hypothetical protein
MAPLDSYLRPGTKHDRHLGAGWIVREPGLEARQDVVGLLWRMGPR